MSPTGGSDPAWARNGRELFYRGPAHLMSVTLSLTPELSVARRDTLFADPYVRDPFHVNYDVFPSGSEFVMVEGEASGGKLMAIVNWTEELRRRTQSGGAGR